MYRTLKSFPRVERGHNPALKPTLLVVGRNPLVWSTKNLPGTRNVALNGAPGGLATRSIVSSVVSSARLRTDQNKRTKLVIPLLPQTVGTSLGTYRPRLCSVETVPRTVSRVPSRFLSTYVDVLLCTSMPAAATGWLTFKFCGDPEEFPFWILLFGSAITCWIFISTYYDTSKFVEKKSSRLISAIEGILDIPISSVEQFYQTERFPSMRLFLLYSTLDHGCDNALNELVAIKNVLTKGDTKNSNDQDIQRVQGKIDQCYKLKSKIRSIIIKVKDNPRYEEENKTCGVIRNSEDPRVMGKEEISSVVMHSWLTLYHFHKKLGLVTASS